MDVHPVREKQQKERPFSYVFSFRGLRRSDQKLTECLIQRLSLQAFLQQQLQAQPERLLPPVLQVLVRERV